MSMVCDKCGKNNDENARFCQFCSSELRSNSSVHLNADIFAKVTVHEEKKGKPFVFILVVLAVLLIVSAVVVGVILFQKDKNDYSEDVISPKNDLVDENTINYPEKNDHKEKNVVVTESVNDGSVETPKFNDNQNSQVDQNNEDDKITSAVTDAPYDEQVNHNNQEEVYKEYDANSRITEVSASSTLIEENFDHSVSNILKDDRNYCWCEGVKGNGEGEYIYISFDDTILVSSIKIFNGYSKKEKSYNNNGKVTTLRVIYNGGYSDFTLNNYSWDDVKELEYTDLLSFDVPIHTSYLKLEIREAIAGTKFTDTCISKVDITALELTD